MTFINIFLLEWKHFIRSPYKVIAISLFILASVYGIHNSVSLYQTQINEIAKIEKRVSEERQEFVKKHLVRDVSTNQNNNSRDYSSPYWALRQFPLYHFKKPSPSMVFSIGQSEQYGFYKRITFNSSPYDNDLSEEIANPERLQIGTFDFSFALLFLLPLVLMILAFNIKSNEIEQGFMSLIEVQVTFKNSWIIARVGFYSFLALLMSYGLILYGSFLMTSLQPIKTAIASMMLYTFFYILFWSTLFLFIIIKNKNLLSIILQMSFSFILFAFVTPGIVHQLLSINYPVNLMTDIIDVRDQRQELYAQPHDVINSQLRIMYPQIENASIIDDSLKVKSALSQSIPALVNNIKKNNIDIVEEEIKSKIDFVNKFNILNPIVAFQNKINALSKSHYDNYKAYRNEIQFLIDKQINVLIEDIWSGRKVDESRYKEYSKIFTIKN